jgi:hypothetical protein
MTGYTVGDTWPPLGGTASVSLTAAGSVTAVVKRSDLTTFARSVTLGDQSAAPGSWTLPLITGDLSTNGIYSVEIEVTWAAGGLQTFGPTYFPVTAGVLTATPVLSFSTVTFGDLIEEIVGNLQGYTAAPDQVTSASADIGATDLLIPVDDASVSGRGMIEIGNELMWVQSVNTITNTFTVLPRGRGWKGSTAQAHAHGDTVVVSPAVPRFSVSREINNLIISLYPDIYAMQTLEFTYNNILKRGWALPATALAVLDVRWKNFLGNWERIRSWETENGADLTDFPTGKNLRLRYGVPIGRTIQVVYAVTPTQLVNETDLFTSSGLPDHAKDLIVLGTMARIIPNLDVARLSVENAPASELATTRPQGGAISIAKYFEAKYAQRLQSERSELNRLYPARIHFTR